jgi:hypothetical protein
MVVLAGCAAQQSDGTYSTRLGAGLDPEKLAAAERSSGAKETTLAAFCKSPPATKTEPGAAGVKASCSPKILAKVADAKVFDKGNGAYAVIFPRPVQKDEICDKGVSRNSVCGSGAILPTESIVSTWIHAI